MKVAAAIGEDLVLLGLAVAETRARVVAGGDLDLADFARRLEELCADIATQPREDAVRHGPILLRLRDELDGLAADIGELLDAPQARPTVRA
jgi:hypothetical protein